MDHTPSNCIDTFGQQWLNSWTCNSWLTDFREFRQWPWETMAVLSLRGLVSLWLKPPSRQHDPWRQWSSATCWVQTFFQSCLRSMFPQTLKSPDINPIQCLSAVLEKTVWSTESPLHNLQDILSRTLHILLHLLWLTSSMCVHSNIAQKKSGKHIH